jgi:hypothetical protein
VVVFNRPKLHLVQLWHFLTNHSTILELGSQLSGAKNSTRWIKNQTEIIKELIYRLFARQVL